MTMKDELTCGSGRCDCYVHDFVAELLDIDSTKADGYKSKKIREVTGPKDPGRGAIRVQGSERNPPRPRKPKEESDAKRRERVLAKTEAELNYLLPSTARFPIVTGSTGPSLPEGFAIMSQVNEPIMMKYEKNNYAVVRRLSDIQPETISNAMLRLKLDMIEHENKEAEEHVEALRNRLKEFKIITESTGPK